jgi:hypothetical protein
MSGKPFAVALAAVLAASGASVASAGGDDDDRGRVIRLTATNTGTALVENGQAGLNIGDRVVAAGDLLRGDEKVGHAGLDCALLRVEGPASTYTCTSGVSLPDGQIAFQGLAELAPGVTSLTNAVTGGTGRYRTARGEATLALGAGGGLTGNVTIRLR